VLEVTFVGRGLIDRLPETFAGPNVFLRVVGPPDGPLLKSKFIDEYITTFSRVGGSTLAQELIGRPELRSHLQGLIIFSDDEMVRVLAGSSLTAKEKARILPAGNPEAFDVLGSKVGLADACQRLGIASPRQMVARSLADLPEAIARVGYPCLVKAATGGGGAGITRLRSLGDIHPRDRHEQILDSYVVQEYVHGQEILVDVAFRDGRVAGWLYTQAVDGTQEFGPSTVRRYQDPPSTDFVESLATLADWGQFNGLFNCAFIREESSGRHLLIEADPRPNAWHQFGPRFRVDWPRVLANVGGEPIHPEFGSEKIDVHLYPREISHALSSLQLSLLTPWLKRAPGTWDTRSHVDPAVNAAEALSVVGPGLVKALQPPWRLLPETIRHRPRAIWAKTRFLSLLGIPWSPPQDGLAGGLERPRPSVH